MIYIAYELLLTLIINLYVEKLAPRMRDLYGGRERKKEKGNEKHINSVQASSAIPSSNNYSTNLNFSLVYLILYFGLYSTTSSTI